MDYTLDIELDYVQNFEDLDETIDWYYERYDNPMYKMLENEFDNVEGVRNKMIDVIDALSAADLYKVAANSGIDVSSYTDPKKNLKWNS